MGHCFGSAVLALLSHSLFAAGSNLGISDLTISLHVGTKFHMISLHPELIQAMHSSAEAWNFRCPSPCWVPFGPTAPSMQIQTFINHCLLLSPFCSRYCWAVMTPPSNTNLHCERTGGKHGKNGRFSVDVWSSRFFCCRLENSAIKSRKWGRLAAQNENSYYQQHYKLSREVCQTEMIECIIIPI